MTSPAPALASLPLHITDTALANFEFNAFNALPYEVRITLDPRALLEKLCADSMARADRQEEMHEAGKLAHVLDLGTPAHATGLSLGRLYGVVKPNAQRAPRGPEWALVTVVPGTAYDQSLRMGLWRPTAAQPRKPKREKPTPTVEHVARAKLPAPVAVEKLEPDSILGTARAGALAEAPPPVEPAPVLYLLRYREGEGECQHVLVAQAELEGTVGRLWLAGATGIQLFQQVPVPRSGTGT